MAERHAMVATAHFGGAAVGEVVAEHGQPLELGRQSQLGVPVPQDAPYLLRATWVGPSEVLATDAAGHQHRVSPDESLLIEIGEVAVSLRVVRRFRLRRTAPFAWSASLIWGAFLLGFSVTTSQAGLVWKHRCEWFGVDCPTEQSAMGASADYIARLLKRDLSGDDDGAESRRETPEQPREIRSIYLPAGDDGPKTNEGGAAQVADAPQRHAPAEPKPKPKRKPAQTPAVTTDEAEVVLPPPEPEDADDEALDEADGFALDDEDEPDDEELRDPTPERAEEEEGWGFRDWLDAAPRTPEEIELRLNLEMAKRRLAIDPDDPYAIATVAYFQYLSQDYVQARKSFDRFIALMPDDPAGYNNLALVLKREGQYEEEEKLYRYALAIDPSDTYALNNLAVNLSHQGRHDEALEIMDRLQRIQPDDPYADLHRAKIYADKGDDEKALAYAEKAVRGAFEPGERGRSRISTLHHIEFRQDIRVDPSFRRLRADPRFRAMLKKYYGDDSPLKDLP